MREKYLEGRAAWVTGGASGMGRAIAMALAEVGADVAIGSLMESERAQVVIKQKVHLVSEDELERTRTELAAHGVRGLAQSLDVCSNPSVQVFYDRVVATFGQIDILVNAAGTFGVHLMVDHPDALWHRTLDVNLHGPYRTIKRCLPGMVDRRWGRIINVASTAAQVGAADHSAYCAAKAGLLGLTRCVALEGAPHGVSCNAINPGYVATPMNRLRMMEKIEDEGVSLTVEEYREQLAQDNPQRRLITPEEIGTLAAFLCRDEAFGINAQDVTVSGGSLW